MLLVLLYLWSIAGAIVGLIFFCKDTLPVKGDMYKTVVGILCCGPILWVVGGCVIATNSLETWLRK